MQGLADGYFVLPYTLSNYLAQIKPSPISDDHAEVRGAVQAVEERLKNLMSAPSPKHGPDYFHRKLGKIIWNECGMSRNKVGLEKALQEIPALREEFQQTVSVPGSGEEFNQSLEKAGRVADLLDLGELMCHDALDRNESCGCHFREEYQTEDGEAKRDDQNYTYVSAWEYSGDTSKPKLNKEPLKFEFVKPSTRSYK